MQPELVIIKSSEKTYCFDSKLGGLYPLERNILVLLKTGIPVIYLDLNEEEKSFYLEKIHRLMKMPERIAFLDNPRILAKKTALVIPSNLFTQSDCFERGEEFFSLKKNRITPQINSEQFLINDSSDIHRAEELISQKTDAKGEGYITRRVNELISFPAGLWAARKGIHPDYFTVLNIVIGIISSVFMILAADTANESSYRYHMMAMAGIFFYLSFIFNSIGTEVSRITFRNSKKGEWLDSVGNGTVILLFLISSSYLNYFSLGSTISVFSIAVLFTGLTVMLLIMAKQTARYGMKDFFSGFERHFIQLLPDNDILVRSAGIMSQITRREFFSLIFCFTAIAGMAEIIIPLSALAVFISTIIIMSLSMRYKNTVIV